MSRTPKLCVYCGSAGVTKEHFWGRWSKKLSTDTGHNTHLLIRYPDPKNPSIRTAQQGALNRPGAPRSQTLKIACTACNTGWMKRLQDEAIESLIKLSAGNWDVFRKDDQESVARWAAMFTMSFEFADRETVIIPQQERAAFSRNQRLSPNWTILCGVCRFDPCDGVAHLARSVNGEPFQITVFDFGSLLVVTFYGPTLLSSVWAPNLFAHGLRQIQPYRSDHLLKPFLNRAVNSAEFAYKIEPAILLP